MTTALYAQLCTSGVGVTPDAILRLTPRQIHAIYQHPRDKDGQVVVPQVPPEALTLGEMLDKLRAAAQALHLPADQLQQAEETLRRKYGGDT